ncbi:ATP-binding cassette domain-containing protein [Idiomarina sp.]|uniref:ABC transporter ATP-binding protein n=1 Tax=Idiomarina sp. TaxID=1874361 RepID=UPI002EBD8E02|nr:ATP-binding cassette domain-containing protein [Pseudomonadota bacterium]
MTNIELNNVSLKLGDNLILDSITLTLPEGQYQLTGKNGAGKSTFLQLLSGLIMPSSGSLNVDDRPDLVADSIQIPDNMTVTTVFSLYDKYQRCDTTQRSQLIEAFQFSDCLTAAVGKLSQGNQQKLKLILALSGNGHWLLLDEPFNGLDSTSAATLNQMLAEIHRPSIVIDHSEQLTNLPPRRKLHIDNKSIVLV